MHNNRMTMIDKAQSLIGLVLSLSAVFTILCVAYVGLRGNSVTEFKPTQTIGVVLSLVLGLPGLYFLHDSKKRNISQRSSRNDT